MSWTTWTIHDVIFFAVPDGHPARYILGTRTPANESAKDQACYWWRWHLPVVNHLFAIMRLLPKPDPGADSLAHDIALIASCSFFAGLLILSATQIIGGAVQVFKRWRYYRRNAR